jgi:1-acyl-sn-glycerol-3-phosphate acyltransferase
VSRTSRRFRRVAWIFRFVRPLFAKVDVRFVGERPAPGPLVFVANHNSFFDIPVGLEFFLRLGIAPQIAVHRRFFRNRIVGGALRYVGAVPVEAGTGQEWLEQAVAELEAGGAVALMPEGAITSENTSVGQLRTGVVRLADASGAPVVPIGVFGTEQVWPLGRPFPRVRLRRPTVVVTVGERMTVTGLAAEEFIDELATTIDALITSGVRPQV